jgi:pimeloyl-ACP methyl ester carboxylesterase
MTPKFLAICPSRYVIRESLPTLHFRDSGKGDLACVFVHGFGEASFVWHDCAAEIASLVRVIAVDLRGHGDSEWDASGRYDTASHVKDVLAVLSSLSISWIFLVGHSLGGEIALRLAGHLRHKLAALVLVDFSPEPDPIGISRVLSDFDAENRSFKSQADYRNWLGQRRPLAHPSSLDRNAAHALRETSDGVFKLKRDPEMRKSRGSPVSSPDWSKILWDTLSTISCPALVVRGSASAVLSREVAERMAKGTRSNAQLTVVKMAGHAVMADNPEGFNRALTHFILPVLKVKMAK